MKKMTKLISIIACLLPSLVMAHPKSSEWGDLGLIEREQVLEAAIYCDNINGAKLISTYTQVELDGSVGYQGVYNYIYTTIFTYSNENGQKLSQVRVVSEYDANIDITPISYNFKIINIRKDGVECVL